MKGRCPRPLDDGDAVDRGGGARRDRTADLYNAIVALSQLSYGPTSRGRQSRDGLATGQPARPFAPTGIAGEAQHNGLRVAYLLDPQLRLNRRAPMIRPLSSITLATLAASSADRARPAASTE